MGTGAPFAPTRSHRPSRPSIVQSHRSIRAPPFRWRWRYCSMATPSIQDGSSRFGRRSVAAWAFTEPSTVADSALNESPSYLVICLLVRQPRLTPRRPPGQRVGGSDRARRSAGTFRRRRAGKFQHDNSGRRCCGPHGGERREVLTHAFRLVRFEPSVSMRMLALWRWPSYFVNQLLIVQYLS